MKKTFITNFILLMSVNLLVKPFWILGIDRGVQNAVGYESYGIYTNLFAFSLLFITLLDLGINNYTSSTIARDPSRLNEEFGALTTFKLTSALIYLGLTLFLGHLNGYNDTRLHLLWILAVNQILSYFYTFFRSIVGGLQMFRTDAMLSVVDRLLMIVLVGSMLWFGIYTVSIEAFIFSQTLAYSIAVAISFFVIRPHLHHLKWHPNAEAFLKVVRNMMPYALLSLLMTFYTRLDVVLMPKLLPDGDLQNGIYASAYRLLEAANMMAALVAMLLLPMFSRMIEGKENLNPLVQFSTGLMLVPAFGFCMLTFLYRDPIIHLLNHQSTDFSAEVFGLVMCCFFPLATMYVYGTLLTANRNFKTLNVLAALALVLNVLLNVLLIPTYKAYGAAIAAVVTQGLIGVTNFGFGLMHLKIQLEQKFLRNLVFSFILLSVTLLTCHQLELSWWIASIVLMTATTGSLLGLKIIDLRQAALLLKAKAAEKAG